MTVIELAGDHGTFVVDDEDAAAVQAYTWNLGSKGYIIRTDRAGGRKRTVRLHRWLLGLATGDPRQGDHIDGDPRNNRRRNLRVLSQAGNAQNRRANRNGPSSHRGVHRRSDHAHRLKPWVATAYIEGRQRSLGYFATELEAAEAAADARRRHMPYAVEGR